MPENNDIEDMKESIVRLIATYAYDYPEGSLGDAVDSAFTTFNEAYELSTNEFYQQRLGVWEIALDQLQLGQSITNKATEYLKKQDIVEYNPQKGKYALLFE